MRTRDFATCRVCRVPRNQGVSTPILPALYSGNQILPHGPIAMSAGVAPGFGSGYSVTVPSSAIRPIALALL